MSTTLFQRGLAAMCLACLLTLCASPSYVWAQETTETIEEVEVTSDPTADLGVGYALDNAVLFIAAVLVFFMQAGFAMVEAGFNAAKNTVNILFKNSMDICVGVLIFFVVGYGLMYPSDYGIDVSVHKYFAFGGIGLDGFEAKSDRGFSPEVSWLFQAVFAATAATIVSGAVAGRMQVGAYLIYSAILTGLVYPISGMWKWGGGWLHQMGFADFAGSAVVHGVGGFAGLAGAIILGPRLGRYVDGKSVPMPGHNMALAALGVFILWFGWYGFNPGSQLAFQGLVDATDAELAAMPVLQRHNIDVMMHCAMTTTLAAGAGGLIATLLSWGMYSKPDLSMGLNGILGGLVGITACCDVMSGWQSIMVGGIAGVLVIIGVIMLDKLRIDDPVGAWPVHGLCGLWGCLAIGVFGHGSLVTQAIGSGVICAWSFVTMLILFSILKAIGILRVSPEEEQSGLDISEHGMKAYIH